jgi:antibiotic biosynthesis monooxygenase (ABM) superfamily enzyme
MNDKSANIGANDKSVTVVITRRPVSGREAEYRQWAADISVVSEKFPGHLGAKLQGPTADNEYHIIFRFDCVDHLQQWENSMERAQWVGKLNGIVEGEARVDRYCGLEFLFSSAVAPVQKYKMALVLIVVVFVMISILGPIVRLVLPGLPALVQLLLTVVIQVSAMTYSVMPYVTRVLKKWLQA